MQSPLASVTVTPSGEASQIARKRASLSRRARMPLRRLLMSTIVPRTPGAPASAAPLGWACISTQQCMPSRRRQRAGIRQEYISARRSECRASTTARRSAAWMKSGKGLAAISSSDHPVSAVHPFPSSEMLQKRSMAKAISLSSATCQGTCSAVFMPARGHGCVVGAGTRPLGTTHDAECNVKCKTVVQHRHNLSCLSFRSVGGVSALHRAGATAGLLGLRRGDVRMRSRLMGEISVMLDLGTQFRSAPPLSQPAAGHQPEEQRDEEDG